MNAESDNIEYVDIAYCIEFYSDWHCGSGLSAGADVDLLVIKDRDGLPFVPGKTMKGLLREAVEEICRLSKAGNEAEISKAFGRSLDREVQKDVYNKAQAQQGSCFFTNAILEDHLSNSIKGTHYVQYLYRAVAATAIDEGGIATENSLRRMEVCIPCTLMGKILDVPVGMSEAMANGMKYIKRLGQNRNRGLGRCSLKVLNNERDKE